MMQRLSIAKDENAADAPKATISGRVLVAEYSAHDSGFVNAVFVIGRVGLVAEVEYFNNAGTNSFRLYATSKRAGE